MYIVKPYWIPILSIFNKVWFSYIFIKKYENKNLTIFRFFCKIFSNKLQNIFKNLSYKYSLKLIRIFLNKISKNFKIISNEIRIRKISN